MLLGVDILIIIVMLVVVVSIVVGFGLLFDIWYYIVVDFFNLGDFVVLVVFGLVLMIDFVFVGDNVIVVGVLVVGLFVDQCKKVILIGIGVVLVLCIFFVLIVMWLMGIVGLIFVGGLLFFWVSWKFWCEICEGVDNVGFDEVQGDECLGIWLLKGFVSVVWVVVVVDVLMSFDNVFVVVGVVCEYFGIFVIGLLLLVVMMGFVVNYIVWVINWYCWIVYVGFVVIVIVVGKMIYEGWIGIGEMQGIIMLFS